MAIRINSLLIVLVIVILSAVRLIHLEADTPLHLGSFSMGLYVDEGYKTLDARDRFVFGNTQQTPYSARPLWSPFTQSWFYLVFSIFGQSLGSARLVSIFTFFLLLLGYTYAMEGRYPTRVFYLARIIHKF